MKQLFLIFLITGSLSCSFNSKSEASKPEANSNDSLINTDNQQIKNDGCEIITESYRKVREQKIERIEGRFPDSTFNSISEISIVIQKLHCINKIVENKINKSIMTHLLNSTSEFANKKFKSIEDCLNFVETSGVEESDPNKEFHYYLEFVMRYDSEISLQNQSVLSIKSEAMYSLINERPLVYISCLNFNLESGNELQFEDVFIPSKMEKLKKSIKQKMQSEFKDFYDYEFYKQEFELSKTFFLTKKGITFFYQTYGNRTASIDFDKEAIKEYIKIDAWSE